MVVPAAELVKVALDSAVLDMDADLGLTKCQEAVTHIVTDHAPLSHLAVYQLQVENGVLPVGSDANRMKQSVWGLLRKDVLSIDAENLRPKRTPVDATG